MHEVSVYSHLRKGNPVKTVSDRNNTSLRIIDDINKASVLNRIPERIYSRLFRHYLT